MSEPATKPARIRLPSVRVDLCVRCEVDWTESERVSVTRCAACGRGGCTCMFERNAWEDEDKQDITRYFCLPGIRGGCTPEEGSDG